MRAVVARHELGPTVVDVPVPLCEPGAVLIRASVSLISPGTELYYARQCELGEHPELRLGYCSSGVVEQVGDSVSGFAPGDRVIAMGWNQAVHADFVCVPQRLCIKVHNETPLSEAVYANLAATAVHARRRAALTVDDRVLVLGGGLVGQLTAQLAADVASSVHLVDPLPNRVGAAAASGLVTALEWRGDLVRTLDVVSQGFDVVFLCMGGDISEAMPNILSALSADLDGKRKGRLVIVGRVRLAYEWNAAVGNVDLVNVARCGLGYRDRAFEHGQREYECVGKQNTVTDNLRYALHAVQTKRIRVGALHSESVSISASEQAYRRLYERPHQTLGITLHYD